MDFRTTVKQTQTALENAFNDKSLRVVALTGSWGTGKTHLWKRTAPNLGTPVPLTVSAFGATSITELKKRLLQEYSSTNKNGLDEALKAIGGAAKGATSKFFGIALDDIALLGLPKCLKSKIVAIDDIERKHKNFDIEELLGFINEYSEKHDTRFLLLLNTDKLEDKEIWQKLHEKVIDAEIALAPSPEEAFNLAINDTTREYFNQIKSTLKILEVTNIRIIKRVLHVTSIIFAEYPKLDQIIYDSLIPSTVLLVVAHYRGIKNGLTLDYLINSGHMIDDQNNTAQRKQWSDTVYQVRYGRDTFASQVISFLMTGTIDHPEIGKILEPRIKHREKNLQLEKIAKFTTDVEWNPHFSKESAKEFYDYLVPIAYEIEASNITSLSKSFELLELTTLSDQLLQTWIERLKSDPDGYKRLEHLNPKYLHPKIAEAQKHLDEPATSILSLEDAISNIRSRGMSSNEAHALKSSTHDQYMNKIESLQGEPLKDFIEFHLRGLGTRENEALNHAYDNFESACQTIYRQDKKTRLPSILERAFKAYNRDIENTLKEHDTQ